MQDAKAKQQARFLNFVFKMLNSALKVMRFVLEMMNLQQARARAQSKKALFSRLDSNDASAAVAAAGDENEVSSRMVFQ